MEYDPIKFRLKKLLGKSVVIRRMFHFGLEIIFLRAWYVRRELWRLSRRIGRHPRILDAGMGFGQYSDRMLRTFADPQIVGLEIDRDHLYGSEDYFRQVSPETCFVIGDVQKLPLNKAQFNLILSVDVMEHIPDDVATFREFFRVLKPGGYFVMHTPRNRMPVEITTNTPRDEEVRFADMDTPHRDGWMVGEHVRDGYRDTEARERLEGAGFQIKRIVHGYGPAGMVAWTLLQRIPMSMLKGGIIMILPVVLYLILALPLALIAMLLDLIPGNQPEGGGLLVVAQRPE